TKIPDFRVKVIIRRLGGRRTTHTRSVIFFSMKYGVARPGRGRSTNADRRYHPYLPRRISPVKPLRWIGSTLDDLRGLPEPVQAEIGYALFFAQIGDKH